MGLLDVLRGRSRLKTPAPDRLFALTTADVRLSEGLGIRSRGTAGLVFQPLATADFKTTLTELEELVAATAEETETRLESSEDDHGYRWMVLRDPDIEDLVVGVNAAATALEGAGYGDRLLCAVFAYEQDDRSPVYFIYNYKRGAYYPFVPGAGEHERDNEAELRLRSQVGSDLPIEPELERWFPLWGIPI